ncbi:hypothetical protein [Paenibacillus humicola]|uniref:hypothetical protein n=1 Tax=Paenibacillus humicola TaxID=3110540 RepID=UPI00237A541B|nr:hypothetical protein [Paenibacillus humicola]
MLVNVFLVTLLMSQVSYFTRKIPEIGELSTYIQFFLFALVLWILFRVPLFHSFLMNFAGISASFVIGAICAGITYMLGLSIAEIKHNEIVTASLQLLSFIFYIGIARLVYTMNWGFDYVPAERRQNVEIRGTNSILITIIAVSVVASVVMTLLFRNNFGNYVDVVSTVVFLLTLPIFLFFSLRKDNEDAA